MNHFWSFVIIYDEAPYSLIYMLSFRLYLDAMGHIIYGITYSI